MRKLRISARPVFLCALAMLVLATPTMNNLHAQGREFGQGRGEGLSKSRQGVGSVYVLTNAARNNGVAVFSRDAGGRLDAQGTTFTGGRGTGGLLDAQGSLILSEGGEWLFAVNAGSDTVTVFAVQEDGRLIRVDRVSSGGERPISLSVSEDLLYVLNSGGTGNITAFTIGERGRLSPLPDSTRQVSTTASAPCPRPTDAGRTCNVAGPAQVQFSPGGDLLIVTEHVSSRILTYTIGDDGRATPAETFQGVTDSSPFGFDFAKRNRLIVSNAFLDLPGLAAASSYILSATGNMSPVTFPPLGNGETASCWLVVTNNGRYAITSNPLDDSLTTYTIEDNGSLTLLDATAGNVRGGDPRDMDLTDNGRFLYVLNNITATVTSFRVRGDGRLSRLALNAGDGFPSGAVGIAAH